MKTTSNVSERNRYFNFDQNTTCVYLGLNETNMLSVLGRLDKKVKNRVGVILLDPDNLDFGELQRIVDRVYKESIQLKTFVIEPTEVLLSRREDLRNIFASHAIYQRSVIE